MPELPEVETIVRTLRSGGLENISLPGRRIQRADLLWERTLAFPGKDEFLSRLPGQQVVDVSRRGKYIQIGLEHGFLMIHLRMSGDIRVENQFDENEKQAPLAPHDRVVITLDGEARFVFNDPRKFGRVWLVNSPEQVIESLGPEPLSDEFSAEFLEKELRKRRRQMKPLLLDQSFIAGLGNIYTDEALHAAGIHPTTLSDSLTTGQAERLWGAIRQVLEEGIRHNGSSIDWVYRGGDFQNHFRVYQRTGQPCPVCGTAIMRVVVGQRGTHFCPICQPKDGEAG
jgi:formamidopyrimidine-DNA glycosylase